MKRCHKGESTLSWMREVGTHEAKLPKKTGVQNL